MTKINEKLLVQKAIEAREQAYCPYSHYAVGAALLCRNGNIYLGCNIENAAYSVTNCAERTALFKAVSEGERDFLGIAVVGSPEGEEVVQEASPCGVCRQALMEFVDPKTFYVFIGGENGKIISYTLEELLLHGFGPKNLEK